MMSNDDRAATVARYVDGRMDADERRRFEDELRADPDLRKMTDAESLIHRVAAAGRAALEPIPPASRERFQRLVESLSDATPARRSGSAGGWLHISIDLLLVAILALTLRTPRTAMPPETPGHSTEPAQVLPTRPASSSAPQTASHTVAAPAGAASPADTARRDTAPTARRSTVSAARHGTASGEPHRPDEPSATQSGATSDSLTHAAGNPVGAPHRTVIGSDSTALPMSLRPPKINQKRNRP
jgi:anti-sigma-K factor RskA